MNDNERNEAKSQFVLMKVLVLVFIIPPLIVNEFERKYTKTLALLDDIFQKISRVNRFEQNPRVINRMLHN
jgi:hypothetical protein